MTGPIPEKPSAEGHRRTKIVATIGPATRSAETMVELIGAGADVFRLNLSHGTRDEHAETVLMARAAAERCGREIGLLADLPGPKLRLEEMAGGAVTLEAGSELRLTTDEALGTAERLPIAWAELPGAVTEGDDVYLSDGQVRLRVRETGEREVRCLVEVGGTVTSHAGLNLPGSEVPLAPGGPEDMAWVDFALDQEVDLLAVSFVRAAEDVAAVEDRVRAAGRDTPVIAKIERRQALDCAEELIRAATAGVMVARGDLGIEMPLERVPVVQKRLLGLAGRFSRPSITATEMVASMVTSSRPTRAEASDVANAIYQGTDAVMLSEETAVGSHPVEAVRVMDAIARETEPDLPYGDWVFNRVAADFTDVAGSVARAAVGSTYTLGLSALVVPTVSGRTARLVSAHRPQVPVLAVSTRIETVRRLNLLFGVQSVLVEHWDSLRQMLDESARLARESGVARPGELIGITAGLPEQGLGTNLFEIHRVS